LKRVVRAAVAGVLLLVALSYPAPGLEAQEGDSRFFPETKQTVRGGFWKYWQGNGGLAQQGFPISGELQEKSDLDGKTYTVQYFERAVFEWHPENPWPYDVLLTQLGTLRYKEKYPQGAPGQKANTDAGTWIFPETGKSLGGSFQAHWKRSGGVAQLGFPISEEFQERSDLDGKTYTVQYFERAVFEWHPDNQPPHNVLLSQLGTFRFRQRYPQVQPTPTALPVREWIAPVNISRSGTYDNLPAVVVSPASGEISVGWEQRDEGGKKNNTVVSSFNDPIRDLRPQVLQTMGFKQTGGVKARHDGLGRKHFVWWGQSGSTVCNYYARLEADGRKSVQEEVPGTCGRQMKLTAVAVGPDHAIHAIFARDNVSAHYYHRAESGAWGVQGEALPSQRVSAAVAIVVSNGGTIMAALRGPMSEAGTDIFAGVRTGPGAWALENVSGSCCTGCPGRSNSYLPSLAADPAGGIRLAWADEQCDPRTDPRQNDIYYREWQPGSGWTTGPIRIVRDPGDAFENGLAVDGGGISHIVYGSDPGTRLHGNYRLFYVSGQGDKWSAPQALFTNFGPRATFHKSPSLDYWGGWLHLAWNADHEGNKEVYYSNKGIGR
jgi:hypothetical protein